MTHGRGSDPGELAIPGRVALVTGGARGIGRGIAEVLGDHGARIHLMDIDPSVEQTAAALRDRGMSATASIGDVTNEDEVATAVAACIEAHGTVEVLVNNAGIVDPTMVQDTPLATWRRVLDVNLTGAFICSQAVLPTMTRQRFGKIVNISSPAAKRISYNGGASYTASKAGLEGFTRHLAYEVADLGINVNAISPGTTQTRLATEGSAPGYFDARAAAIPRARLATPLDTAYTALFLVSPMSDYICGAVIDIDGGAPLAWYDLAEYRRRRVRPTEPSA